MKTQTDKPDVSTSSPGSATGDLNEDDIESIILHDDDTTSDHSIDTQVEEASEADANGLDSDFEDKAVSCFRFFVLFVLISAIAGAGTATWYFMTENQNEDFVHEVR
jgi:hypothetical protein